MEIRRSSDRLISTVFPILVRWLLYIESGPWLCHRTISPWVAVMILFAVNCANIVSFSHWMMSLFINTYQLTSTKEPMGLINCHGVIWPLCLVHICEKTLDPGLKPKYQTAWILFAHCWFSDQRSRFNPNPGTRGLFGPDACISIYLVW